MKRLLACGVWGPAIFVAAFLIEGATRPGYSAWVDYVSDLSLGTGGWMQTANFLVGGWLMLGFAVALTELVPLRRVPASAPPLFAALGLSMIAAGAFHDDPVTAVGTAHGHLHFLVSVAIAGSGAAACFVLARPIDTRRRPDWWSLFSVATGVLVIACFAGSLAPSWLDALPGLTQRIALVLGAVWTVLLAWRLMRPTEPEIVRSGYERRLRTA